VASFAWVSGSVEAAARSTRRLRSRPRVSAPGR